MMKKRIVSVAACGVFVLGGCSGNPQLGPPESEVFATQIKPNNAKIFGFSIVTVKPQPEGRNGMSPPASRDGAGPRINDNYLQKQEMLVKRLELKLEQTGYCRDGFIEINTYETKGRIHLLGECNESATEADREAFPNNK